MGKHIVLVEDDDILRDSYADLLKREKYDVTAFDNQHDALDFLRRADNFPDCILIDILLHDEREAGFQLCAKIRELSKQVPIIFLTEMDGELHRSSALRLDADDFLNKSVSFDFLLIRIEALIRRVKLLKESTTPDNATTEHETIEIDDLRLDKNRLLATWKSNKVELTLTQFWILSALVERVGHVKSHDQLMAASNITVTPNTITAHIAAIRDRLQKIDEGFNHIKTVRGVGYRWEKG